MPRSQIGRSLETLSAARRYATPSNALPLTAAMRRCSFPTRGRSSEGGCVHRVTVRGNREGTGMAYLTRRSFLCSAVALAAAGSVARPSIANAAATTATMWWAQGFVQDEDVALKKVIAEYEKASGNKIDLSIIPFAPERQKIVSALTSGGVPDLFNSNPGEILSQYAWKDQWVDVTDVVETQKTHYHPTALLAAQAYNK